MALSKKHFKELARIAGTIEHPATRRSITGELVSFCAKENSSFAPTAFREAVEDEAEKHLKIKSERALRARLA